MSQKLRYETATGTSLYKKLYQADISSLYFTSNEISSPVYNKLYAGLGYNRQSGDFEITLLVEHPVYLRAKQLINERIRSGSID